MARLITAVLADRVPVLLQKYSKKIPGLTAERIEAANKAFDPTGDRAAYTEWIIRHLNDILEGGLYYVQNLRSNLALFHEVKNSPVGRQLDIAPDINQYGIEDLINRMHQIRPEVGRLRAERETKQHIHRGQQLAELVLRDGDRTIWKVSGGQSVKTSEDADRAVEALCSLTHGGGWCVRDPEWARTYLKKGPAFLIMDGDKRAALYSPSSRQFRDPNNREFSEDDPQVGWAKTLWKRYRPERPNQRRERPAPDPREVEFQEWMEQNVRKESIVTVPRGSWKWQDAYSVSIYYPTKTRDGRWVWRYLNNVPGTRKLSWPQLKRAGYTATCPVGGCQNSMLTGEEVQHYRAQFEQQHGRGGAA